MERQIDKIQIFKENLSTLKNTSLDDNGKETQYMVQSELEVVDFDKVKAAYISDMKLADNPCSSDALYESDSEYYLIEFKNGKIDRRTIYDVQRKIYDSLLIFNDIMDTNISFCRNHLNFILVYNEWKNPDQTRQEDENDDVEPSRVKIGRYFTQKANKRFVRFDLERFKTIYFHDVFTCSVAEFEKEFLNSASYC
jgi:hypothetical protein